MLLHVMRIAMNMLVSKGINTASRSGKDAGEMIPEERRSAQSQRQNIGRVRQAAYMLRRFMR